MGSLYPRSIEQIRHAGDLGPLLMRVESGGKEYLNGNLITSGAGAMGLMQVMPGTYDELRDRYNLGDDPFDPHDNIMAGVAYMREMYELYGSPGLPCRI